MISYQKAFPAEAGASRMVVPMRRFGDIHGDGGRIAVGLLPLRLAMAWARMERAGIAVVLVMVFLLPQFLGHYGIAFDPVGDTLGRVLPWAIRTILLLSGNGDSAAEGIDV